MCFDFETFKGKTYSNCINLHYESFQGMKQSFHPQHNIFSNNVALAQCLEYNMKVSVDIRRNIRSWKTKWKVLQSR